MDLSALTQLQTAALLSVTPRTLRDWEKAGRGPPRNPDGTYPGPAVVAWEVSRHRPGLEDDLDGEQERARKDKEQADKLALENAETRGDVARVSVMERELSALFGDHRSNVLAGPSRLAPQLVGLNAAQIRDRLESWAYEVLGDLASYRPGRRSSGRAVGVDEGGAGSEAAAEADGKPVGRRQSKTEPGE
jgi:hypothetical protein